jgi:hypothetical protein
MQTSVGCWCGPNGVVCDVRQKMCHSSGYFNMSDCCAVRAWCGCRYPSCSCLESVSLPHTILYLSVVLQDKQTKIEPNDTYATQPGYMTVDGEIPST